VSENDPVNLNVLETDRLRLRRLSLDDAAFILELVNDPSWLRFIGDKGVRTIQDAQSYLLNGPIEMYARVGFGLYLAEIKESCIPIGICGLIKRDSLADVDIGFAYLPRYWSQGHAYESASAVLAYGRTVLGLRRIVAITSPENLASTKLLGKLGLRFETMVTLPHQAVEVCLYASDA
jgi:RimJ/RimL family protein N-acetyltransferase